MVFDPTAINFVMNVLQAASYLGVPSTIIEDMVKSRAIPYMHIGDRVIFSKAALDHWVYSKSMENLKDDLPPLGFHERPDH